jgi:hypothetical protein
MTIPLNSKYYTHIPAPYARGSGFKSQPRIRLARTSEAIRGTSQSLHTNDASQSQFAFHMLSELLLVYNRKIVAIELTVIKNKKRTNKNFNT